MAPGGIDATLGNRFWLTGDFGKIRKEYDSARTENAAGANVRAAQGDSNVEVQQTTSDTGLTLLSRTGGNERYRDVFNRAKALGRRAADATNVVGGVAEKLKIDVEALTTDLVAMDKQVRPKEKKGAPPPDPKIEQTRAKSVLTTLLMSDEFRARAAQGKPLSRQGVESLLNAGLGCLKLIRDGQATEDSLFELVRGEVYDITQTIDVLRLSVKTAQKARELFVGADRIRRLAESACHEIDANRQIPEADVKQELKNKLMAQATALIAEREKLSAGLDVTFKLGNGSKSELEKQLKDVREAMRAFRYDLDRIGGESGIETRSMGFMERIRRGFDDVGRKAKTLTANDFTAMRQLEADFNEKLAYAKTADDQLKLDTAFSRAHFDAVTNLTHLANNRIRYYFSGKEQRIEDFRKKAHKELDPMVKLGGSRTFEIEIGADAKFLVDAGIGKVGGKAGGAGVRTLNVTVNPGGGEVTVTTAYGGKLSAEASVRLGLNDGDVADKWGNDARARANVLGGSVGAKAAGVLMRTRTVKYRNVEDFIASLGGSGTLVSRSPSKASLVFGRGLSALRAVVRGFGKIATAMGLRIAKSREDNAVYVAKMRSLGILGQLDEMIARRTSVVQTHVGTNWTFGASVGADASLNMGSFKGVEKGKNGEDGTIRKSSIFSGGVSLEGSYERTFSRTATDYRTHLDTARSHTRQWLEERVGNWYNTLTVPDGEDRTSAALRDIESQVKAAEDALARLEKKDQATCLPYAETLGDLALRLAYLEKLPGNESLNTQAFASRIVNPRVEMKADVYNALMQHVANVTRNGSHRTTVDFSVDWEFGRSISENHGDKAAGTMFGEENTDSLNGFAEETSLGINAFTYGAAKALVPTSCKFHGTYTYTTPVDKNQVTPWSNAATHTWTVAMTPGLTVRALAEFLARQIVDKNSDIKPEDRAKVIKSTLMDLASRMLGEFTGDPLMNALDIPLNELTRKRPKNADFQGSSGTNEGVGPSPEFESLSNNEKRMSFTVIGGRLTGITVDDLASGGFSLGFRVGTPTVGGGLHWKETMTRVQNDRAVLVSPDLDQLMGCAESCVRMGDRESFKSVLTHNAPGVLRLIHDAHVTNPGPDGRALWSRLEEAYKMLEYVYTHEEADSEVQDRAHELVDQLSRAAVKLIDMSVAEDADKAKRIDAMTDFAWEMTQTFLFAREMKCFARDDDGRLRHMEAGN